MVQFNTNYNYKYRLNFYLIYLEQQLLNQVGGLTTTDVTNNELVYKANSGNEYNQYHEVKILLLLNFNLIKDEKRSCRI